MLLAIFLVLVDREAGDVITQLKLQKLVYFAQGVHLALFDKPLFLKKILKHGKWTCSMAFTFDIW
ncbi:hypothetical protein OTSGILL_1633 [Orientia tsutsugamushi str. Gilliam]|uniref:Uncharacterized protein n=1 Tax=Orientia tsutsugamushi str. Gilliam TaxID=1359184 RepID=A0A0F3MCL4_ORITS|nr:hypothetical protein OTSGILL_1633 [Orientia tsutsugamushi str. Gilliam]